jgi:proteasome lid subunit RPN8/RPN11
MKGLLLSPSSAANIAGALKIINDIDEGVVVTMLPDNADKYGELIKRFYSMLVIEQKPLDEMYQGALRSFPDECCGFFFGNEIGKERIITNILTVDNSKEGDKKRRFEIAPKDYMNAEKFADENELQLLGVYHSHPNHPAVPSEHDRIARNHIFLTSSFL